MWPPTEISLVAMGAMRLSTDPGRDDERSMAVLHEAFDAGVRLIDTADAYALDATDAGHNERLIARAVSSWNGDRSRITVMTKGGLTRPEGRWVADGRARHLTAACHASREALGGAPIALYQLHAPDPRVDWMTSVRALAALQRSGVVDAIGICNVTVGQIEAARSVIEVAAVQVEISPWNDHHVASGVAAYCRDHGIRLLAYRPFGGLRGRVAQSRASPCFARLPRRTMRRRSRLCSRGCAGCRPSLLRSRGDACRDRAIVWTRCADPVELRQSRRRSIGTFHWAGFGQR